jgi:long-chain acyl-CoA synthetase
MKMAQAEIGRLNALFLSGAAPLPEQIREAMKKEIGNPVGEGYGLTETGPLTHINPSGFSSITGFMAKEKKGLGLPIADTEAKIVDPDTRAELPLGESGEIVVRGPQVMKGYWPTPGAGLTEEGWLHTGDIGFMDKDGYFYISDRIKDMINVSGNKVYSTLVDETLYKHPSILMAAAFGIPDPNFPGSERVMAVVRLKDDHKGRLTEEDILAYCRENLAPYAVPKVIEIRDDLPVTVTEKLFKKELREQAVAGMKERGELPG